MPNNPIDCNVLLRLIGAHGRFSARAKVAIDGPGIGCAPNIFRAFCSADTTLPVDPRANVGGNEISDKTGVGLFRFTSMPISPGNSFPTGTSSAIRKPQYPDMGTTRNENLEVFISSVTLSATMASRPPSFLNAANCYTFVVVPITQGDFAYFLIGYR